MLKYMMELKGKFATKMIRKAQFASQHFDESNTFLSQEKDILSGQQVVKKMSVIKPGQDLRVRILGATSLVEPVPEDEQRLPLTFVDLLDKCLILTPDRRMTAKEALHHPFITVKV